MTGAKVLIECLREQEVEVIFGYPGGAVLPIYDALYDVKDIRHVITAHEQNATHAADGYARATGKPGVVLVTSGPGATNTVTGIATAYMDSVPMVVFTGQVATSLIGRDSFQEVDIKGITTPITKHNFLVKDVDELADTIRKAFMIARSGRPGPVLVDIPRDVQVAKTNYMKAEIEVPDTTRDPFRPEIYKEQKIDKTLDKAVDFIEDSKRPIILAGGGITISGASQSLVSFAKHIGSPVVSTLMGLGGFPADNDLFLGMVGMHGTRYANYALTGSDLIIAVGTRFSDRVVSDRERFGNGSKIIHIDIDAAEIDKNVTS
ncbi:MAG: acetolactate synthase large subunit, partial [Clostridiales bacterium]|nr:acetolactate synthase large subunit [Clostridiales bacterium]